MHLAIAAIPASRKQPDKFTKQLSLAVTSNHQHWHKLLVHPAPVVAGVLELIPAVSGWSWGHVKTKKQPHTACGNVWAHYQSALMCVSLHCKERGGSAVKIPRRYRENMQTPHRQPEHPTSLSANQFVFDRLPSMTFQALLNFPSVPQSQTLT